MITAIRPELANADGVEVTEYLVGLGWSAVATDLDDSIEPPSLVVQAEGDRDLEVDLSAFVPTAPRGEYVPPLPDSVRLHTQHLRDYLAKDPAMITNAESVHVIKDLIRAAFYLNARLEAE